MTTVVEPDGSQLELLRSTLQGATALTAMHEVSDHIRAHAQECALVVGPSVSLEDATDFAQWARIHRPALGVILLRHRVDSVVLAEALRSGMREVVEARDLTGAAQAVHRAQVVAEAMQATQEGGDEPDSGRMGRQVTVFSTKGGVGKSLVATNLAVALAQDERSVCLVDLDVHSGDVAIMLQLTPSHHLNDLSLFGGVIDEGAVTSIITPHRSGLSVIAAPVKIDSPDQATPESVGSLLERLKTMFEVIVVDTSGIFDDHALVALDRTDTLVLVGTLDIPALKSLKLSTGTLDLLNFPRERWRFILNRADAKVGLSVKEFEETLGLTADCQLVSSRDVLAAVNRGEALLEAYPNHPNSKALKRFARELDIPPRTEPSETTAGGRRATQGRRRRLKKVN